MSVFNCLKREKTVSKDELRNQCAVARRELKQKWVGFNATVHFKEGVPLIERIEAFVTPAMTYYRKTYPSLLSRGPGLFWANLTAALLETETCDPNELDVALKSLEAKGAV
jgi:hypothetical protein